MSHIELRVTVYTPPRTGQPRTNYGILVPTKLFETKSEPTGNPVLVMWINEDQLGMRPLRTLFEIIKMAFPRAKDRLSIRILGPTDSDMLRAMVSEHGENLCHVRNKQCDKYCDVNDDGECDTEQVCNYIKSHEPKIYSQYATTTLRTGGWHWHWWLVHQCVVRVDSLLPVDTSDTGGQATSATLPQSSLASSCLSSSWMPSSSALA
jgi:hypothetical protein